MVGANFARRKGIIEPLNSSFGAAIPSVSSLQYSITIPKDEGASYASAIDKFYASLRSGNTGSAPYTKRDLEGYILNLRTALLLTRHLRRAYGVLKKFDLFDKTVPTSIFKAMGLDFNTFTEHAADLRQMLNFASVRLHTVMPGKLDILERTAWMEDNIFTDSNDAKAQLYLFTPDVYLPYYDWATAAIAELTPTTNIVNYADRATYTGLDYATAVANYQSFIDTILASDKVQLIAADILKVYGPEQMKYFNVIDENYEVNYTYSEEVLTQIQNARILGGSRSSTAVQDTRVETTSTGTYFASDAHFVCQGSSATVQGPKAFINFYKDNISSLELIGATRLTWTCHPGTVSNRQELDTFGTEIINSWNIVGSDIRGAGYAFDLATLPLNTFLDTSLTTSVAILHSMLYPAAWATFDWAPMIEFATIQFYDYSGTQQNYDIAFPIWDYNNYALVEKSQLDTYNAIAGMSLYYVPKMVRDLNLLTIH